MQVLESNIERRCVKLADDNGCTLLKLQGTMGWPDRLLLRPNGTSMFIEFKRPGESLKPMQKHIQKKLREMHFQAEEVDSSQLFLRFLLDSKQPVGSPQSTRSEV